MRDSAENRQAISRSIATWLSDLFESSSVIPHPFQKGMLSVTYARFGYQGDTGTIVAGSFRPDFPVEQERLLISVGSDQAAIAIQQRRAIARLHSANGNKRDYDHDHNDH